MCTTFNTFKVAVELHIMQVEAMYLTIPLFVHHYREFGPHCLVSDTVFNMFEANASQPLYDRQYLYDSILSATITLNNKSILKYASTQDSILALDELKEDYAHDGSIDL